jgi:hypothetical protein
MRTCLHNGVQATNVLICRSPKSPAPADTNRGTVDLARILQLSPTGQVDLARPVVFGRLPAGNLAGESFSTLRAPETSA